MITVDWTSKDGWQAPQLRPQGGITVQPSANVLQYATTSFEGLRLYRGYDGKLRLFRANLNARRMAKSADRISLPSFDPDEWLKLLIKLCQTDGPRWLPKDAVGTFLYIRPTLIGTDPSLGVMWPQEATLILFLSLMPEYCSSMTSMKLLASTADTVRAWPGGFGYAKVGANYGPTLKLTRAARERGFVQVLWLFPSTDGQFNVTEAGASNFFVIWKTREGSLQLVTAPVDGQLILEGITRRSLLQLAKDRLEDVDVIERDFSIQEIETAVNEGRMLEVFVTGTAYAVSPIGGIEFDGRYLEIPSKGQSSGAYCLRLRQWIFDIMYGKEPHEWGIVVPEEKQAL